MEKSTLHLSFADQEGNGLTDPVFFHGVAHAERFELTAGEMHTLEATIDPATLGLLWINSTEPARLLAIDDAGELIREVELDPRRPVLFYRGIGVEAKALFERPVASLRVASDHPAIINVRTSHEEPEPLPLAAAVEKYAAPLVGATAEPADLATAQPEAIKPGDVVYSGNQQATAVAADPPAATDAT